MNANAMGRFEERGFDSVVCPKPCLAGVFNSSTHDHIHICRWPTNCYQTEMADSKSGTELLDIILTKGGGHGDEKPTNQMASSPPYFCGSPPSRASNPVIQDARFNNEKPPLPPPTSPAPYSPPSRGGCVSVKLWQKPAAVRIEGFDCLTKDGRNCSISAVA